MTFRKKTLACFANPRTIREELIDIFRPMTIQERYTALGRLMTAYELSKQYGETTFLKTKGQIISYIASCLTERENLNLLGKLKRNRQAWDVLPWIDSVIYTDNILDFSD